MHITSQFVSFREEIVFTIFPHAHLYQQWAAVYLDSSILWRVGHVISAGTTQLRHKYFTNELLWL